MEDTIFRERDIRGKYPEEINEDIFMKIGNAMAQHVERDIVVACDARNESISLMNAFMNGALEAEKTVMNISVVPQACAINWTITQQMELAYITGSHLSKGYNGVKFFHFSGKIYNKEEVKKIAEIVREGRYFSRIRATPIREELQDIFDIYIRNITQKVKSDAKKKIKILIDCGNGVNGLIAKDVFTKAGFNTDVIFDKPDGNFPSRGPDPKTDPLTELKKRVGKYDVGIAYDADGDRFFVVAPDGNVLTTGQTVYVILSSLNKDGDIVANVDCGRAIDFVAEKYGKRLIKVKVGQYPMEEAVLDNNAILGIEASQHCFIPSISDFSDAIAASMLFSKAVEDSGKTLKDLIKDVPVYSTVRKTLSCPDERKFDIMKNIENIVSQKYGNVNRLDGVRIDMENGWVLIRPSQTEAMLRLTIEANDESNLRKLDEEFSQLVENEIKSATLD